MTWSCKLKVYRENSQTIWYHIRFSTNTSHNNNILFLLSFFGFFLFFSFSLLFFVCVCFLKQKIYILKHIRLCGWVNFNFQKQDYFFWSIRNPNHHQNFRTSLAVLFLKILTPASWRGSVPRKTCSLKISFYTPILHKCSGP